MTGGEVKRWLCRYISREASSEALFGADQKQRYEALERLADFVQQLPEEDERFVRLAESGFEADGDTPTSCLASRCASYGPNLYLGNDPDAWLTEYSRAERSTLVRHGRHRGTSS